MHKIIQLFVAVLFFGSLPEKKVLETIFGRYYYKLEKISNLIYIGRLGRNHCR